MMCKDHFSGFVWLCALPREEAAAVPNELDILFTDVVYPQIFHTDDGKEFTTLSVESPCIT